MAQKNLDLRTLFERVKLKNTTKTGKKGNSSFDTTDIAYLRSTEEVKNILKGIWRKPLSDFALSNFAYQSSINHLASVLLRSASDPYFVDYIFDEGDLSTSITSFSGNSLSVVLNINLKSLISELNAGNVKITSKNVQGKEKHFIELGEYPGSFIEQQWDLEEAYNGGDLKDGLTCTGRLFTTNGQKTREEDFLSKQNPEFEFNGEKYVRVVTWRNDEDNRYENGVSVPNSGRAIWHKVEPVSLEIQNWDELPRSINPNGKRFGGAEIIKTETEKCILSGLPFYPVSNDINCSMWQNSLVRAFLNSANSSELDKNSKFKSPLQWDFSKSGFLYQAFDMTREATREYTIPESETKIADYAFAGCVGIEKIFIPSHVTNIGKLAFSGCRNSQIILNNPNKKFQLDSEAFKETNFKFVYISKDGSQMIFSPYEDSSLEKSHFRTDFVIENAANFFDSNYRENFVQVRNWKESGKIRFIPPEYTLVTFPSSEMEKYFVNNNNGRWGKLVKTLGFDTLQGTEKTNSLVDLMKIYYAIGGFSENQGESEKAYEYILNYVAVLKSPNPTPAQIGAEIHARFSKLSLKGPYNPDFAKFFMKYYKDNPDFMLFCLSDKDGYLMNYQDYLCVAHNTFDKIQKYYPNRVVNGNEERALLSPRFVAEHCSIIEYEDVDEGNEILAGIVGRYGYDQEAFDHIQEVYEEAKKIKDKYVIRADKSLGKNGITFRVLEKDDPLGFVLGDLTNCCQHIGGAGEECVDDGYKNPNAGFLVFEESILDEKGNPTGETRVLGQAYVWYDPISKTVCYDNIEIPTKILDELRKGDKHGDRLSSKNLLDAVIESADAIMSSMNKKGIKVDRVTTGQGYNDLKNELEKRFGAPERNPKAKHRGYSGYTDADEAQYLIRTYDQTTKLYARAIRTISNEIQNDLTDIENKCNNNLEM